MSDKLERLKAEAYDKLQEVYASVNKTKELQQELAKIETAITKLGEDNGDT